MNPLFIDNAEEFDEILNASGRTPANRRFLKRLKAVLPNEEWTAISLWIATFYGFQQNWLLDPSLIALCVKSRQIGGSFTYAAVSVLWALIGERTSVISQGQRDADRVLRYAKKHLIVLERLGSKWAHSTRNTATSITIATGGEIISLPPTSGARGDSTNVILDEVAYYKKPSPDEVLESAFGAASHRGLKIRVLSTPNGVGNRFFDMCKNYKSRGYTKHVVTVHDAIAEGMALDPDVLFRVNAQNDHRIFGQMYECSFLDSQFQYIPTNYINQCCIKEYPQSLRLGKRPVETNFYAGMDLGRTNDLTVLLTIEDHGVNALGKTAWCLRWLEKRKRTDDDELKKLVSDGFARFQYKRLTLDATGMGAFPAQALVKQYGSSRVNPFEFTLGSKAELATGLYTAFAEKRLIIPEFIPGVDPNEIKLLREDVASIQRIVTENNNVRYDAPHTVTGHADRAWALALAINSGLNAPTYAKIKWL